MQVLAKIRQNAYYDAKMLITMRDSILLICNRNSNKYMGWRSLTIFKGLTFVLVPPEKNSLHGFYLYYQAKRKDEFHRVFDFFFTNTVCKFSR